MKREVYKVVSFILAIAFCAYSFCPIFNNRNKAYAATVVKTGSCGENSQFTLYSDGLCTITGTGAVSSFEYSLREKIKILTLCEGITSINNYAFQYCTSLTSVSLPASFNNMGKMVFSSCYSLVSIKVEEKNEYFSVDNNVLFDKDKKMLILYPNGISASGYSVKNGVTSIGYGAFANCSNLKNIYLCNGIESIGDQAFYHCDYLEEIEIPDSVKSIGSSAFAFCTSLSSLDFGEGLETIGSYAFAMCLGTKAFEIPPSVKSIGEAAFGHDLAGYRIFNVTITGAKGSAAETFALENSFTFIEKEYSTDPEISVPDSEANELSWNLSADGVLTFSGIGTIPADVFVSNEKIKEVVISDGITCVESGAFKDCTSLQKVTVGTDVEVLDGFAFYNCSSLSEIIVDSENNYFSSENGVLFNKDKTVIIKYPAAKDDDTYTIPESVLEIGDFSFEQAIYLYGVNMGSNIKIIGEGAFELCLCLEYLELPESTVTIKDYAFDSCKGLHGAYLSNVEYIGNYAFGNCTNLSMIHWNSFVKSIGQGAFYGTDISDVTIPETVNFIGDDALGYTFSSKYEIKDNFIIYGEKNTVAEEYAESEGIIYVYNEYRPNASAVSAKKISDTVYSAYYNDGTLVITGKGAISDEAFMSKDFYKKVIIGDGITAIGNSSFGYCKGITSVQMSDTVLSVGEGAFSGCNALESVELGKNISQIGMAAFRGCKITYIEIPEKVTFIGERAFSECSLLESINVDENNPSYSSDNGVLFNKDKTILVSYPMGKSNVSYALKSTVREIAPFAFAYSKLENIVLNTGLEIIGEQGFCHSYYITEITIPHTTTSIGSAAFSFCTSLKNIDLGENLQSIGGYTFAFTSIEDLTIPASVTDIGKYIVGYTLADERIYSPVIRGYLGTAAETFALENSFDFVNIGITHIPENDFYIDNVNKIMPNIVENTTAENIINTLRKNNISATIKDKDGNEYTSDSIIGTGSKVITSDGNEYTVIVLGDTDGNGKVSSTDYLNIKAHFLNLKCLEGSYLDASDIDKNNVLSSTDFLRIKSHFIGDWNLYA